MEPRETSCPSPSLMFKGIIGIHATRYVFDPFCPNLAVIFQGAYIGALSAVYSCYEVMAVDEALWKAIVNCETTFDGQFFYGVTTTQIFCHPSCRSRTPIRKNVRVFSSVDEAVSAGFRPCKRCRPSENHLAPDEELVQAAKHIIDQRYQEPLSLNILATELAISPYHLHRVFKRVCTVTLANYVLLKRIESAKAALEVEPCRTVTDIALAVGFRSASHFSTVFQRQTGHSPSSYRGLHMKRAVR